MSKTSRSRPKKVGAGAASHVKIEPRTFSVNLNDDDDEDDFKPSKANPFPSKSKRDQEAEQERSTLKHLETKATEKDPSIQDHCYKVIPGGKVEEVDFNFEEVPNVELEDLELLQESSQPVFKEEEDEDEVTILHSTIQEDQTTTTAQGFGKSAWKNLMEQMQKNQQKDSSSIVGPSTKKTIKSSTKRALMLSPRSKVFKPKSACSPLKKNPRLGSPSTDPLSSKQMQEQETATNTNEINCHIMKSSLEEIGESLDRKALTEMETNVTTTSKDLPSKKPAKVAPIFLPPEERKALQLSKIGKVPDVDTELILDSLLTCDR